MDWPSSAEAEIPQAEGASPFSPAVDPQLGTVPLVRLLARLGPGLRPGPILHGWAKLEHLIIFGAAGALGSHAQALLAEVGVRMCVCLYVCARSASMKGYVHHLWSPA